MQEPVRVQVHHALQDLLHDSFDLLFVQSYPAALRGARTPLEDAQQRAALDEWSNDSDARVVRRQCKGREHTAVSQSRRRRQLTARHWGACTVRAGELRGSAATGRC